MKKNNNVVLARSIAAVFAYMCVSKFVISTLLLGCVVVTCRVASGVDR
jgi:hypothetical protein